MCVYECVSLYCVLYQENRRVLASLPLFLLGRVLVSVYTNVYVSLRSK
jgi:hypothetical protein